jgi:hypothetical protein
VKPNEKSSMLVYDLILVYNYVQEALTLADPYLDKEFDIRSTCKSQEDPYTKFCKAFSTLLMIERFQGDPEAEISTSFGLRAGCPTFRHPNVLHAQDLSCGVYP